MRKKLRLGSTTSAHTSRNRLASWTALTLQEKDRTHPSPCILDASQPKRIPIIGHPARAAFSMAAQNPRVSKLRVDWPLRPSVFLEVRLCL